MRARLGVAAAVSTLALAPATGHTQTVTATKTDVPQLVLDGSFFSRYELRSHYDDIGVARGRLLESDGVAYRARLGLATSPVDIGRGQRVSLRFVPQASGFWADSQSTLADAALGVHEAAMILHAPDLRLEVGRFEMAYGEHLVIGNVGWHETGRSFDGARLRLSPGASGAYVDAFVTQLQEGRALSVSSMGAGDQLFAGLYAGIGPALAKGLELDVYGLGQMWAAMDTETASRQNAFQLTLGTRVRYAFGPLDYRAETGLQLGTRPRADGTAAKALAYHGELEVGAKLAHRLRLSFTGFFASGDDPATMRAEGWDQLFPTAHRFLGLSDIIGARTNIAGGTVGARIAAAERTKLVVDAHLFARPETPDMGSYAGAELDAGTVYTLGKGLTLRGLYALFLPARSHYGSDVPVHYVELELRYELR